MAEQINLDVTKITTDELCKFQMDLSDSISRLIENNQDATAHRELWKSVVEEIVRRNS